MPELIHFIEKVGKETNSFMSPINPYSFLCGSCSTSLSILGKFNEGRILVEKALLNSKRCRDSANLGSTLLNYGIFFYWKGDWESAKEHLEIGLTHSEISKVYLALALNLCTLGHVYTFLGDPGTGREMAEKGLRIYQEGGIESFLSYYQWVMGCIFLDLGDLESAQTSMKKALRLSRKNNEKAFEGLTLVGIGRVFGKQKQETGKIEGCFFEGLDILHNLKLKNWYSQGRLFLGEFFLEAGQKQKALENLKEAEALFQEMGMDYWLERTRTLLAKVV